MSNLIKKDLVDAKKVKEFFKKCCKFLVSVLQIIFKRSPLQSAVRSSRIFDLNVMGSYSASDSEKCIKGLLHQLMSLTILQPTFCDKVRELS